MIDWVWRQRICGILGIQRCRNPTAHCGIPAFLFEFIRPTVSQRCFKSHGPAQQTFAGFVDLCHLSTNLLSLQYWNKGLHTLKQMKIKQKQNGWPPTKGRTSGMDRKSKWKQNTTKWGFFNTKEESVDWTMMDHKFLDFWILAFWIFEIFFGTISYRAPQTPSW